MYLIEIILEGFKSFATTTSITDFDKEFNAITGLNGSGKSNILDAICFALGITHLSYVRVGHLQEFIFNSGRDDIKKATVTLVFDNSNKDQSPIEFKEDDKISLTRMVTLKKSKFSINGVTMNAEKIRSIFEYMRMNVNNPQFMVLQGKITQVALMSPKALYGVLKETAGVGYYEHAKEKTQKALGQKTKNETQMLEDIMENKLEPEINTRKKERKKRELYATNQEKEAKLANLIQFKTRASLKEKYEATSKQIEEDASKMSQLKNQMETLKKEVAEQKQMIQEMTAAVESNNQQGKMRHLKEKISKINTTLGRVRVECENSVQDYEQVYKEVTVLQEKLAKTQVEIELNQQNKENAKKSVIEMEEEMKSKELELEEQKEHLSKLDQGEDIDLVQENKNEVRKCKEKIQELERDADQKAQKIEELKKDQNETMEMNQKIKSQNSEEKKMKIQNEIQNLQQEITRNNKIEYKLAQASATREAQIASVDDCNRKLTEMKSSYYQLNIQYRLPYPSFDPKQVKGRVARLFTPTKKDYIVALEELAGRRLANIVVENEKVAKDLLGKNCFNNFETLLPQNKMLFQTIPQQKHKEIKDKFNNKAIPALSVITYEGEYDRVMKHLFGNAVICANHQIAEQITYVEKINVRCATLTGELVEPSGVMSGGGSGNQFKLIEKAQLLKNLEESQIKAQLELETIDKECQNLRVALDEWNNKKNLLQQKQEQLSSFEKNYSKSQEENMKQSLIQLEAKINNENHQLNSLSNQIKKCNEQLQVLQKKEKELSKATSAQDKAKLAKEKIRLIKKHLKDLEKEIQKTKLQLNEFSKKIDEGLEDEESLKEEFQEFQEKEAQMKIGKEAAENKLRLEKEALEFKKEELQKAEEEFNNENQAYKNLQGNIQQKEDRIEVLEKEKDLLFKEKDRQNEYLNKLKKDLEKFGNSESHEVKTLESMKEAKMSIPQLEKEIKILQQQNMELKKELIDDDTSKNSEEFEFEVEKFYQKKENTFAAGEIIQENIELLEIKFKESIQNAFAKINEIFGGIFSTLLPGSNATLVPISENLEDGIQFHVSFGTKKTNSLEQLSGGQKSLLALSYILAMLSYKPSPIYILDEIDAALDLSYTQNIGKMIKNHFPQSQFIIVSLKQGMFSNANSLFKIECSQGRSQVTKVQ